MKYYRYNKPKDSKNEDQTPVTVTLSEQEILDSYWDQWYTNMCIKFGKTEYSTESCIRDWKTVHRAWEVEDCQSERC